MIPGGRLGHGLRRRYGDAKLRQQIEHVAFDVEDIGGAELQKIAEASVKVDDAVIQRVRQLVEIKDLQEAPAVPKGEKK